ncbi:MAG: FkbM family methyltransferase [Oligoflexales bacterium]|nr:FkbM family methyltransferase [Oligoflexales bacterium]
MTETEIISELDSFMDCHFADDGIKPYDEFEAHYRKTGRLCLFGAGAVGAVLMDWFEQKGWNIELFCDNNPEKHGKLFCGRPVLPSSSLDDDITILISTGNFPHIEKQLSEKGLKSFFLGVKPRLVNRDFYTLENWRKSKTRISELLEILEDESSKITLREYLKDIFSLSFSRFSSLNTKEQYFPDDLIHLREKEVFVDVGAYDGDTIHQFLKKENGGKYAEIHAFEVDPDNFLRLKKNTRGLARLYLHNVGLFDRHTISSINKNNSGSEIVEGAKCGESIELVRMDDILPDTKATFIKMDIEGAEKEALAGAETLIKKHAPTLAICVYHKAEDIWEIPLYLKRLVPEYRIYLRHHTDTEAETVCYAICDR